MLILLYFYYPRKSFLQVYKMIFRAFYASKNFHIGQKLIELELESRSKKIRQD